MLQNFTIQDPALFWTAIGSVATFLAFIVALLPFIQSWRKKRLLSRTFGAELYDENTIVRSTKYYVEPFCTDADPGVEVELRKISIVHANLFDAVDRFLEKESPRKHLLLLADSGMGKTSFMLNYYASNQKKWINKKRIAIVPLGISDADKKIQAIDRKNETILFLDAFDEDTKAVPDHRNRILDLMQKCREFKRVLITCRTQFFLSDEEIVDTTGIIRIGSTGLGEKKEYEFMKLYISPLDDDQVKVFLRKRYRFDWKKRKQARALVAKVPLLTVRPMLLAYIPDLIETKKEIRFSVDIYQEMIEAWALREYPFWENPDEIIAFSERLAVDLYTNRETRGQEKIEPNELETLAKSWGFEVDGWKLTGRSLLNRDAGRNYKFAHRSIMEYFFARQVKDNPEKLAYVLLSEQIQRFLMELHDIDTSQYRSKSESSAIELGKRYGRIYKHEASKLAAYVRGNYETIVIEVPEGEFLMGTTEGGDSDESPQHIVHLSAYQIGKYPVTNLDFYAFIQDTDHSLPAGWNEKRYPPGKSDHPVVGVTWHDAIAYCEWLSEKAGKHFTLPTEAQWEKAARGTEGRIYPWGDEWKEERCNSDEAKIRGTTSVGMFSSLGDSPYGVSDMAGNVWEWCIDDYGSDAYKDRNKAMVHNPQIGPASSSTRVCRGGSFLFNLNYCRCAFRNSYNPLDQYHDVGFRIVVLPFGNGTLPDTPDL